LEGATSGFRPWLILDHLNVVRADEPIPADLIASIVDDLRVWARDMQTKVVAALRAAGKGSLANGVLGTWRKQPDQLYGLYFGNRCNSHELLTKGPGPLDGTRASVVFYVSYELHGRLLDYLRGLPEATVLYAERRPDSEAFARAHKYVYLNRLMPILKTVENDLDNFSRAAEALLGGSGSGHVVFRSPTWSFDFEVMAESVLLGLLLTGSPDSINSNCFGSPVAGASIVRAHLETVLFRRDFLSSLHSAEEPQCDKWSEALADLRSKGLLRDCDVMWATCAYQLLSGAHHSGVLLTSGEVSMLNEFVRGLRDRMIKRSGSQNRTRSPSRPFRKP
jgi:hypothetical protein